jgi:hypothetical protein
VRLLRRIAEAPANVRGDVCGLPAAVALVAVMVGDAEPVDWKPTAAERREAAARHYDELEALREARGFTDEAWLRQEGMARRYGAIAAALREDGR